MAIYDKKIRRPRLFWKRVYWFRAADYMNWLHNPKDRGSHLKARFAYGFKYEGGLLSPADKQIFNCFNSFSRLDTKYGKKYPVISTLQKCNLPRDYYFNLLKDNYRPQFDPMHREHEPLWGYYRPLNKPTHNQVIEKKDRNTLIKEALAVARAKKVNAPYFKKMEDKEISKFITKFK